MINSGFSSSLPVPVRKTF